MKKNIECNIIKDLAEPFSKNAINDKTKDFINEHLTKCKECKKYYDNIKSECNMTEKDKDTIIINHFKKVNNHIKVLKIILIFILIFIISFCFFCIIKNYKFTNILDKTYNKINEIKELDNYTLSAKTIYKDLKNNNNREYESIYYYKDGKYKIESTDNIQFCEDNSFDSIQIYKNLHTIEYNHKDFIENKKGDIINIFSCYILNYKDLKNTIYSLGFNIREDRYNGIDCYVIRTGNNEDYRDIWIDKSNFITIRSVNECKNDFYCEEIYTFIENNVKNDDISTKIIEENEYKNYTKIYNNINTSEKMKNIYKLQNDKK